MTTKPIDAKVLRLLLTYPDAVPLIVIAEQLHLTMLELRASMTRLALRAPSEDVLMTHGLTS